MYIPFNRVTCMNLLLRNESRSVVVINILAVTCSDARYFDDNDYYRYRSSALAPIWSRGYEWYDRSDRQVGERCRPHSSIAQPNLSISNINVLKL